MNFNLTEEQALIEDSVKRFVSEHYDYQQRNAVVAMEHGFNPAHWRRFAELGWLSIPFAADYGGFDGGAVDEMVIMQAFGRGLVAEPYLPTVLLFGGLLQRAASDALKAEYLPRIIAGELQGALACNERQSRYELTDIETRAREEGGMWRVSGAKTVVLNGAAADKFIVTARTGGAQCDDDGITLLLVDAAADGLERTRYRMTDGQEAANLVLRDVRAEAIVGDPGDGLAAMSPVIERAMLAACASALGAMDYLHNATLEYCKTRRQFDVPIGSFQALQHRLVDSFAACENTRSLLYRAVCAAEAGSEDAQRSLLALKVMAGRAGRHVASEAIQLHGGMGMTNEMPIGAYVKRLMILNTLFGDADYHQARFAALANATGAGLPESGSEAA